MSKWRIMVNGTPFASYDDEQKARAVFAMVTGPRPKNSYDWRLVNPVGACVKTVKSPIGKGKAK